VPDATPDELDELLIARDVLLLEQALASTAIQTARCRRVVVAFTGRGLGCADFFVQVVERSLPEDVRGRSPSRGVRGCCGTQPPI
jgi:hypothetical protein